MAELRGLRGVGAEPPGAAVVDRGPGRGGVGARRRQRQVDGVIADGHREHRRQLLLLGAAGGAQAAQRAVDAGGAVGVGADPQRHLGLERVGGGVPAAAAATLRGERTEQGGREQAAAGEVAGQVRAVVGAVGGDSGAAEVARLRGVLVGARGTGRAVDGRGGRGRDPVDADSVIGHHQASSRAGSAGQPELAAVGLQRSSFRVKISC